MARLKWKAFTACLIVLFALTACLPEGVRLPQSPYLKKLERKSGLIAYLSADGNIATINQAGDNQHPLTDDAEKDTRIYQLPIWSPLKRQLAFIWLSAPGGQIDQAGLVVAGPDADRADEVFSSDKEFPRLVSWSPDGEQLSFSTSDGSSSLERLRLVDTAGGESAFLDVGSSLYWDWSPDSSKILLHAGGSVESDPQAHLSILDVESEHVDARWKLLPADFSSPDWSPADRIALAVHNGGKNKLVLVDSQGSVSLEIGDLVGEVSFAWSPDGSRLAYSTKGTADNQDAPDRLVVVNPKNLDEVLEVRQAGIRAFFWSPDSRRIATRSPAQKATEDGTAVASSSEGSLLDLRVLDLETGASRSFTTFIPTEQFARWLADDYLQQNATIWSPDSQNLVIAAYDADGKPGIFVVDGSGSLEPRYLVPGLAASWSWK